MSDQLERELDRAAHANQVVGSPLWDETWNTLRENLVSTLEQGEVSPEAVQEARRMLVTIRRVRRNFEEVIQTGKLARRQLDEEHKNG